MSAVSLVISDVDGTLVTPDKTLTEASIRVVHQLHARGIGFTVISSRPPFGLRMLVEPLALALPLGAFNGGAMVKPTLEMIEQRVVPESAAIQRFDGRMVGFFSLVGVGVAVLIVRRPGGRKQPAAPLAQQSKMPAVAAPRPQNGPLLLQLV